MKTTFATLLLLVVSLSLPIAASATSYLPGQTLNPSCSPSDSTCVVVPNTTSSGFIATSSSATSTFAGAVQIAGTASSTNIIVSNSLTIANLSGILKSVAGVITSALVNLASDVTGVLGITNGGTGTSSAPSYGQILIGTAGGGYALTSTSSLGLLSTNVAEGSNLYFTNARVGSYINSSSTIPSAAGGAFGNVLSWNGSSWAALATSSLGIASGSSQWTTGGSNISYSLGSVGIGTTSPSALLTLDSTSTTGTILRLSNTSSGGHVFDLLSTGSGNTNGAGHLDIFDSTVGLARLSIAANGNVGVGTTSPFTNFGVYGSAYFTGNLNVGDTATTRSNLGLSYSDTSTVLYAAYNITAWGDSLTSGGEDGTGVTYPKTLSTDLGGRPVVNEGVGGQTSTQIGVRQGGVTSNVMVSGGQIPALGGITVTFVTGYEPVTSQGPAGGVSGSISGIAGTVTLSGSTYTFTRSTNGATTTVSGSPPFVVSNGILNNGTVIIWAGRNNYSSPSQVESDIANMTASLGSNTHYLVLSVLNGNYACEYTGQSCYNQIIGINNNLASTYTGHYLDIRTYLIQHGLSDAGITPSSQDLTDISNDIPPTDLRYDSVHLNATGYQLIARQIANFVAGTLDISSSSGIVIPAVLPTLFASPYAIGSLTPAAGYFTSIGVGTTSPTSLFEIAGNLQVTSSGGGIFFRKSDTSGGSGIVLAGDGHSLQTGGTFVPYPDNTYSLGIPSQRWAALHVGTAVSSFGGSVGVGTSTPSTALAVVNGSNTQLTLENDTGIGATTGINFNTPFGGTMHSGSISSSYYSAPGMTFTAPRDNTGFGGFAFNSNGGTTRLMIDTSNGNIGIGTTSPSSALEVVGNIQITNSNGTLNFRKNSTSTNYSIGLASDGATLQVSASNFAPATDNTIPLGRNFLRWASLNVGTGVSSFGGSVGVGTSTPYSRLEVWGPDTASTSAFGVVNNASTTEFAVYDTGNAVLAGGLTQNSDQRLKTNIQSLDASSSLFLINMLNPVTFNWIDPQKSSVPQFGFIAQEIRPVFPDLISTTSPTALTPDGTLSLNYIDLISPIVSAIQALDKEITSLAAAVAGYAEAFTTHILTGDNIKANNELCVGSTCVTPAQFQAMVAAANKSSAGGSDLAPSNSINDATDTPPVIQINGSNPAVIQVDASYSDLGATITGPQADLNLGIKTFLNGVLATSIVVDTTQVATDTIDYVVSDSQGMTSTSTRTVIIEAQATGAATTSPRI